MTTEARLVVCTFPSADEAASVAQTLVRERLAACVNIVPGARSIYRWQGEVHDEPEVVAFIKTGAARLDALRERIVGLHSYDCPEVIAFVVDVGHLPYLDWIAASTDQG
jgi:periplasmic divalent cation tolerance protein